MQSIINGTRKAIARVGPAVRQQTRSKYYAILQTPYITDVSNGIVGYNDPYMRLNQTEEKILQEMVNNGTIDGLGGNGQNNENPEMMIVNGGSEYFLVRKNEHVHSELSQFNVVDIMSLIQ
jgi:hypothetical protein